VRSLASWTMRQRASALLGVFAGGPGDEYSSAPVEYGRWEIAVLRLNEVSEAQPPWKASGSGSRGPRTARSFPAPRMALRISSAPAPPARFFP